MLSQGNEVPPHERGRFLHPVRHVGGAADDEGVVLVDGTGFVDRLERDLEPASLECLGNSFRDSPRGTVATGVRNKDPHPLSPF